MFEGVFADMGARTPIGARVNYLVNLKVVRFMINFSTHACLKLIFQRNWKLFPVYDIISLFIQYKIVKNAINNKATWVRIILMFNT